ncbi:translation machinery-associated protein 20 [Durotheca rogersii]|uniref:translation machinery-associated protein 20 n=1 Tax=Durotheca rogersii TaxID=419775 RepID=UPI00221F1211|nr:translation machinery-associated protein 20 [Durotheca rogersii]KAI5865125.1 translation machinery-associated protein 20 [Durotheca rogersii]
MPLVVPGITQSASDPTTEWATKLVGKTVSEDGHSETNFCKKDLPQKCRVIKPGMMVTKDFVEDRLNVHVKADGTSKLKSSVQRSLRQSLLATYPLLGRHIDEILPRKSSLEAMKLPDRCTLYVLEGQPLFFQHDTATLLPHLRLVHRFPGAFPSVRIDRGAIRFVLSGATLMAPGLTSPGGRLPHPEEPHLDADERWSRELPQGAPVVVRAEGKTEACAVGFLLMGTREVREKGKGPVIEDAHYLGDGLWRLNVD